MAEEEKNAEKTSAEKTNEATTSEATSYRAKMVKRKAVKDKILAAKTRDKGLLIVHTGKGKGKTTAAMGLVLRALGRGMRVVVLQFIKGKWDTGEKLALERFGEQCKFSALGEGFTWETQDKQRDIAAVQKAWQQAEQIIKDGACDLLLLDELNIALRYEYLQLEQVLTAIKQKPEMMHIVITGRNARQELIDASDLTTEMQEIKHPFRAGIRAQSGIEF